MIKFLERLIENGVTMTVTPMSEGIGTVCVDFTKDNCHHRFITNHKNLWDVSNVNAVVYGRLSIELDEFLKFISRNS